MDDVLESLLNCRPDDIANARDVGLDERLRSVAQIDRHDRSAVDDAITAPKGSANRCDVADVALDCFERTLLRPEDPPRFVGAPYERPDLMAGFKQGAYGVRSG
jgi:hypothetical protein